MTTSQGFITSPNWPGDYPANAQCTWEITPERNKRILIVIPQVLLGNQTDRLCRDILVMRQSGDFFIQLKNGAWRSRTSLLKA